MPFLKLKAASLTCRFRRLWSPNV